MIEITPETASRYFENRLRSAGWTNASSTDRQKALHGAALTIDALFEPGQNATICVDGETLPAPYYTAALCEQALWMLCHDVAECPAALLKGVESVSLTGASVSFSKDFVAPVLCRTARHMLECIGSCRSEEHYGSISSTPLDC